MSHVHLKESVFCSSSLCYKCQVKVVDGIVQIYSLCDFFLFVNVNFQVWLLIYLFFFLQWCQLLLHVVWLGAYTFIIMSSWCLTFLSIKCFSLNLPYLEIYFLLCEYSHSNFFKISFCIVYLLLFSVNPCFYLKIVSCRQQIVLALFSFT